MVKVVNRRTPYINVIRIREKLISYVKLDHTFHQNKYGNVKKKDLCVEKIGNPGEEAI